MQGAWHPASMVPDSALCRTMSSDTLASSFPTRPPSLIRLTCQDLCLLVPRVMFHGST